MKNSIYDINYLWIMFVILHMCGASLLMIFYGMPYLYLILLNAIMLLFIVYISRVSRVSIIQHLRIKKLTVKEVGFTLVMTISLLIMAEYINAVSLLFANDYVSSILDSASDHFLMTLITYAIVPGIVEEMMFRGCMIRGTSNKKAALLVSAVTFALLHGNLNQICYALFMGLAMGIVVLLTDNLVVTIMIHCLFNSYSIVSAVWKESPVLTFLERLQIGPYAIFNPVLEKSQLGIQLGVGFIVFVLAGIFSCLMLKLFYKERCHNIFKSDSYSRENIWKPDWKFGIGCIVCIVLTILSR